MIPVAVSTETWIYFNFPNSEKWVTSICQRCKGRKPRGLTPTVTWGSNGTQDWQDLTISLASAQEMPKRDDSVLEFT